MDFLLIAYFRTFLPFGCNQGSASALGPGPLGPTTIYQFIYCTVLSIQSICSEGPHHSDKSSHRPGCNIQNLFILGNSGFLLQYDQLPCGTQLVLNED